MRELMAVTKALADESRVRVLLALGESELCVCQIVELLGLAFSTVSKHMAILKQARLVESRKDGRWIYYRLAEDDAPLEARVLRDAVCKLAADAPQTRSDAKRLKQVLQLDTEDLCRKLNRC